mmetsp:Transcript_20749/g.36929  ORF Transcript_20749/g.36929 Transcript_20749/m.36929 type:complete len:197 (-) Transcript_20749:324-914(-)
MGSKDAGDQEDETEATRETDRMIPANTPMEKTWNDKLWLYSKIVGGTRTESCSVSCPCCWVICRPNYDTIRETVRWDKTIGEPMKYLCQWYLAEKPATTCCFGLFEAGISKAKLGEPSPICQWCICGKLGNPQSLCMCKFNASCTSCFKICGCFLCLPSYLSVICAQKFCCKEETKSCAPICGWIREPEHTSSYHN